MNSLAGSRNSFANCENSLANRDYSLANHDNSVVNLHSVESRSLIVDSISNGHSAVAN
jgi:hypothetical protein